MSAPRGLILSKDLSSFLQELDSRELDTMSKRLSGVNCQKEACPRANVHRASSADPTVLLCDVQYTLDHCPLFPTTGKHLHFPGPDGLSSLPHCQQPIQVSEVTSHSPQCVSRGIRAAGLGWGARSEWEPGTVVVPQLHCLPWHVLEDVSEMTTWVQKESTPIPLMLEDACFPAR